MIAVAFTVSCQRQRYLREAINSWAQVRGVQDAMLVFALEPLYNFPLNEFVDFLKRSFKNWRVVTSTEHLGCLRNTRRAMELALGEAEFAAVAEEDLEVATDTLEYLAWAREAYRDDQQVQAVCAHARASKLTDEAAVVRAPWFNPLVWGTWKDRWESFFGPEWGPQEDSANPESWDRKVMMSMRDKGTCSVFPVRSRSIHRGEVSTQYIYELGRTFWPSSMSTCFQSQYVPQDYREVTFPDEPGMLVV